MHLIFVYGAKHLMTNPINPVDNPELARPAEAEMLDILHRVQSGELSVDEAEQLLDAAADEPEARVLNDRRPDGQDFSAPLGKTANGKLVFERGTAGLTVQGASLPGQLFTAHFERHVPVVRVNGGTVTVRYRHFGFGLLNWLRYGFGPPRGKVTLNADIPWQVVLHGGVDQAHLDLRPVTLRGVTLSGGVTDVELKLGEPTGVVSLDFTGGVNNLRILRPAAVAVRLTVQGGAAKLALDSQELGAVGGRATLETPNNQDSPHNYTITVGGGAHNIRIAPL
jgi:hypothetical protein